MGKTLSDMVLDFFEFDDETAKREEVIEQFQWRSDDEENPDETRAFWDSQRQLLQVRKVSFHTQT